MRFSITDVEKLFLYANMPLTESITYVDMTHILNLVTETTCFQRPSLPFPMCSLRTQVRPFLSLPVVCGASYHLSWSVLLVFICLLPSSKYGLSLLCVVGWTIFRYEIQYEFTIVTDNPTVHNTNSKRRNSDSTNNHQIEVNAQTPKFYRKLHESLHQDGFIKLV